jgi:hypothetical protein
MSVMDSTNFLSFAIFVSSFGMIFLQVNGRKKSLHPHKKGPRSFGGATLIDDNAIILSKSLTPNVRRIFPAELKGQVQKGLPRLASTACFLETNDFSTIPCHCFYTVFMITRTRLYCQG